MATYKHLRIADIAEPDQPSASERKPFARHLPKDQQASDNPSGLGLISHAFENVLILEMAPRGLRGYASVFALAWLGGSAWGLMVLGTMMSIYAESRAGRGHPGDEFYAMLAMAFGFLFWLIPTVLAIRAFRIDLATPRHIPLVFNRSTRKVYRGLPDIPVLKGLGPQSWWRFIVAVVSPWPLLLVEYDWDCLEAEVHTKARNTSSTHVNVHALQMYARSATYSQKVLGIVPLAPPLTTSIESGVALWELIRRFMAGDDVALRPEDRHTSPALHRWFPNPISSLQTTLPYLWPLAVAGSIWATCQIVSPWPADDLFSMKAIRQASLTVFGVGLVSNFVVLAGMFNFVGELIGKNVPLPQIVFEGAGEEMVTG